MSYNPDPDVLEMSGDDYEMGRLLKGRVRKRLKKAFLGPAILLHKVTHGKNSPIRKIELKLQKVVGKALPFTKPFIQAHNKIAEKTTYKLAEKAGIGKTKLADKSQSSVNPGALASAYAGQSQNADHQVAAAQLAQSAATGQKLSQVLTRENAEALVSSQAFRGVTLDHLLSKAKGGNQSALKALRMLRG